MLRRQWDNLHGSASPDLLQRALEYMDRDTFAPADGKPARRVGLDRFGIRRLAEGLDLTGKALGDMTDGEVSESSYSRWTQAKPDPDPSVPDWAGLEEPATVNLESAGNLALAFLCAACAADGRDVAALGTGTAAFPALGETAQRTAYDWCTRVTHTDPHPGEDEAADERHQLLQLVNMLDQEGCRALKVHAIGILLDGAKQTDEELYGMMEYLHDLTGYHYGAN